MDEPVELDEHTQPEDVAQAVEPEIPIEPVPPIESRFLFVDVAALRAKQLRRGARLRFSTDALHKAERAAMEEVRRGLVPYELAERASGVEEDA